MLTKLKNTLENYIRILRISRKPDMEDFLDTVRICGIGIAIVGSIGFLFYVVSVLIGG